MFSIEATLDVTARRGRSGASRDLRALVCLLDDKDWQTRRAAADAILSAVATVDVSGGEVETLLQDLFGTLVDGTGAGMRAAAITVLEGMVLLDSTRARALERIAAEMKAAPATVRIGLAGVIGVAGGEQAVALLAPLTRDSETNTAATAIAALGRTRSPEAMPILIGFLDDENDWLRFAAVGALGELGDARSVPRLEPLLEDQLLQEAAASALSEMATMGAARALAKHLRTADGALRPSVLKAIVSLATDERSLPRAASDALYAEACSLFREAAGGGAFDEIIHLTSAIDPGRAAARVIALGWSGDARAVPVIALLLNDPVTGKAAHTALAALVRERSALEASLALSPEIIPRLTLATALTQADSFAAIEAAARLSIEAADAETSKACAAALAHGREWLQRSNIGRAPAAGGEAEALSERLSAHLGVAQGLPLVEIAATLGTLTSLLPCANVEALVRRLPAGDEEREALARLAFFESLAAPLAAGEGEARRALRHPSAQVRMRAIDLRERYTRPDEAATLVPLLTDEAAGVRRAATRAMRRGKASADVRRALLVTLADEDIWVRAETIITLSTLFGGDRDVRARLFEALTAPHPLCRVAAAEGLSAHAETAEDWHAISQIARRDPLPEVRRAAVLAFVRCRQPRTALAVARAALKDSEWPVRHAGVETLAASDERASLRLLLAAASNEEPPVRGAALRALAKRDAPEGIGLACRAIGEADTTLLEDAYAALRLFKRTRRAEMLETSKTCAPRAATVVSFVLEHEE